jgi:hypothetical protein
MNLILANIPALVICLLVNIPDRLNLVVCIIVFTQRIFNLIALDSMHQ